MFRWLQNSVRVLVAMALLAFAALMGYWVGKTSPTAAAASTADVPAYIGWSRCASCHFQEYITWRKTGHVKATSNMPAKYAAAAECLKCHSTGFGAAGGYRNAAATPDLGGVTCESCHGPGSKHEAYAKTVANKKFLSDEEKKTISGTIERLRVSVCFGCHVLEGGHKDHPKYDK